MVRKSLGTPALLLLAVSVPAMAQYIATPRPSQSTAAPPTARADDLTITSKNGQTQEQQWADRYECHRWAKDQSGFDPTAQPPQDATPNEIASAAINTDAHSLRASRVVATTCTMASARLLYLCLYHPPTQ